MTDAIDRLTGCILHLQEAMSALRDAHSCACQSNDLLQLLLLEQIGPMAEQLTALKAIKAAAEASK
jgi:hypothetical protein